MNGEDFNGSESLRTKLQKLREKNTTLVSQNHKLMSELENMGYELQQERSKVGVWQNEQALVPSTMCLVPTLPRSPSSRFFR
jgi:hypothetical protein